VPAFFVILKFVGRRLRKLAEAAREADATLVMTAEEDLEMLPATKAFAVERYRCAEYGALTRNSYELGYRQARINAVVGPAIALIAACAAIALLLVSGGQADSGAMSAGELFALLLYAALLTRPVGSLADFYGQFQWARGTLGRLEGVLATPAEPGLDTGRQIARAKGDIAFKRVTFAYPGRDAVLQELDLEIRAGQIIALTGLNGAGKSTLINLLLRYYQPGQGEILLDGEGIGDIQVQCLRRQFGLVPQHPLLHSGSIRSNITLGMPDASEEAIQRAVELAQADEFIRHLPNGFETEIGDHGVRLSGGQRQRIALARALLPDPPVLIFDEATSMYDLVGEEAFIAACQSALKDRTVIIVTHRRASLALADTIVRIENGKAYEVQAGEA